MMVLLVNTGSPAWEAEMKVGDILLEINGHPVNIIQDYYMATAGCHGRQMPLKINRKGVEMTLMVTFGN